MKVAYLAALLALIYTSPSAANEAESALLDPISCELHIWPGAGFYSAYVGWIRGGTIEGTIVGRSTSSSIQNDPLSTEKQRDALSRLPIATWLGLPEFRTTIHNNALSSREIRGGLTRHGGNGLDCYAELMIDDIVVQDNVLSGKALNVLFRFRRFDSGEKPLRTFGTYVQEPLRLFPPERASDDPEPGLAELKSAFDKSLKEFGIALQKQAALPPKRTKR